LTRSITDRIGNKARCSRFFQGIPLVEEQVGDVVILPPALFTVLPMLATPS